MVKFFCIVLLAGVPFGIVAGCSAYYQLQTIVALYIGVAGGVIFGLSIAWYQRSRESQLRRQGLNADDMSPIQEKSVQVPLDIESALEKSKAALTKIRKLKESSVQVASRQITAKTGITFQSFGEQINVDIKPTDSGSIVSISSRPIVVTTVVDGGKGRENVELFAKALLDPNLVSA
jgi:hypothetical protein